ncbi:hypothetical protein [Advenella mimigardefordensis]|uniref:hypothetical protein n=1 Tax=Advenella mimigardefordensis TaxID=302406 RepID=UPI00046C94B8|nr:hypothetical protein [Advenella mimigardefordensis]
MAKYLKTFTNFYDGPVTSTYNNTEYNNVSGATNYTYTNGLTINAAGQTVGRICPILHYSENRKLTVHDGRVSLLFGQIGAAGGNYQLNWGINIAASLTYKTETALSYNLFSVLFFNPSSVKLVHSNSEKGKNWRTFKVYRVRKGQEDYVKKVQRKSVNFHGLTFRGF